MKLWSSRLMLAVAVGTAVWLIGVALADKAAAQAPAAPPAAAAPKPQMAGEAFKNVSTSTLKGLTVSDFLGAMGVMAAALGYDCADCHIGAGSDKVNWEFDTPKKKTARRMVEMVAGINKNNFGGVQMVTCWTCHHGRFMPATTIGLDALYGTPNDERNDIVTPGEGVPTATQTLDKYIQALGGAQRLAGLTSFIATGTSLGYEGLGGGGSFQIFAKAPNQRTTLIVFKDHPERGDNTRVYNGSAGWIKSPRGLFAEYELTGSELDGARLDAMMSFPGQIKQVLNNWRSGSLDTIGKSEVQVVQGTGPRGLLATLYFDTKSGLLMRMVRYTASPIGRIPTQLDYSDYRDVNGIKFPFKYTFSWLDGRDSFQLTDVKTNVPIDAAKFAKP
jgi:photosynthetic reaction center cytochrome c subunit